VTEERLGEAYQHPKASLADFLRHILNVSKLPSREESISKAFDEWVRRQGPAAILAMSGLCNQTLMANRHVFERTHLSRGGLHRWHSINEPPAEYGEASPLPGNFD
jgi:hypothetical protein